MKSICIEIVRKALENQWDFTVSEGWKCSGWEQGKGKGFHMDKGKGKYSIDGDKGIG